MGKGMKAGKPSKEVKIISRAVRQYQEEQRRELITAVKAEIEDEVSERIIYCHNIDMIGVMFALRDEFGFGKSRLIRAVKRATEHSERMLRDKADVDEMLELLDEETGIKEDDLVWQIEVEV